MPPCYSIAVTKTYHRASPDDTAAVCIPPVTSQHLPRSVCIPVTNTMPPHYTKLTYHRVSPDGTAAVCILPVTSPHLPGSVCIPVTSTMPPHYTMIVIIIKHTIEPLQMTRLSYVFCLYRYASSSICLYSSYENSASSLYHNSNYN